MWQKSTKFNSISINFLQILKLLFKIGNEHTHNSMIVHFNNFFSQIYRSILIIITNFIKYYILF